MSKLINLSKNIQQEIKFATGSGVNSPLSHSDTLYSWYFDVLDMCGYSPLSHSDTLYYSQLSH